LWVWPVWNLSGGWCGTASWEGLHDDAVVNFVLWSLSETLVSESSFSGVFVVGHELVSLFLDPWISQTNRDAIVIGFLWHGLSPDAMSLIKVNSFLDLWHEGGSLVSEVHYVVASVGNVSIGFWDQSMDLLWLSTSTELHCGLWSILLGEEGRSLGSHVHLVLSIISGGSVGFWDKSVDLLGFSTSVELNKFRGISWSLNHFGFSSLVLWLRSWCRFGLSNLLVANSDSAITSEGNFLNEFSVLGETISEELVVVGSSGLPGSSIGKQ